MKIRIALCALAPLVLVAAACGGDDDDATPATAAAEEPAAEETAAEETATEDTAAEEPAAGGSATESPLWANVPEVPNATEANVRTIHEGGVQAYGTIEESRENIVPSYTAELEKNGWTVESSGGDPGGDFGGGVQATYEDGRYLSLGFGGPPDGTTFGQLCVWPTTPSDNNCPQADQDGDDGDDGGDLGPPEEVEGFIPDGVEQFIP